MILYDGIVVDIAMIVVDAWSIILAMILLFRIELIEQCCAHNDVGTIKILNIEK